MNLREAAESNRRRQRVYRHLLALLALVVAPLAYRILRVVDFGWVLIFFGFVSVVAFLAISVLEKIYPPK